MESYPEIITDRKANQSIISSVYASDERAVFLIIHPVGAINTNTCQLLQKEMEFILESRSEVIIFDMEQVDYTNSKEMRENNEFSSLIWFGICLLLLTIILV